MRFFSKLTVLMNFCFLAAVVIWYIKIYQKSAESNGQLTPLPWLEGTLVILGYGAIIVNLFFLLVIFIITALRIEMKIPRWMIIFNAAIFGLQVWFHFILK